MIFLIDGLSCGRPCGKALKCGKHSCIKPCHPGDCDDQVCKQACNELRSTCGHECGAPCHNGPCPMTTCSEKIKLNCACGHLTALVLCSSANAGMHSSLLAAQISDLNNGNSSSSISLKDLNRKSNKLECNAECAKIERNNRLALALQIENPDLSAKLSAPKYSDFLKEVAKKDGNQFDPDRDEVRNIKFPRRETLLIEHAPRNQKPSVELDAHTDAHAETELGQEMWEAQVDEYSHVVLNDCTRTLDAFGNDADPDEVDEEVGNGRPEE